MNQALGLWLLDAIPKLDRQASDHALNVISLVEAILEDPDVVLRRQVDLLKGELIARLKDEGIGYEERMERLEEVEWPKPGKEFIYATYNEFVATRPWMKEASVRPKSIAREMFENWQSFEDYVKTYGLEKCEAVLLRHLSEVYKVLSQTVPPMAKTEELAEAEEFFGDLLRGVDSSLLDEWEKLRNPDHTADAVSPGPERKPVALSRNRPAFVRAVRHAVFDLVKHFSGGNSASFLDGISQEAPDGTVWSTARIEDLLDDFFSDRTAVRLDPEARSSKWTVLDEDEPRRWRISQTLVDPDERNDWELVFQVDLDRSDSEERPVLALLHGGAVG